MHRAEGVFAMNKMSKIRKLDFPPIGLRIIKSAIGVFLCFLINMLRGGEGIVFYSQLAVLWCMQDYISETKAKAQQRTIGTTIGAVYGLIVLMLLRALYAAIDAHVADASQDMAEKFAKALVVSVFIVLTLYTTVVIGKKQASYFSCVVFLSIVVNHLGDANPYLFVWNRFLDTMIGIILGVIVNSFSLPRRRNRGILFVSGVDETLLNRHDNLSGFEKVELNRMIEDGALFTVSTMRTPAAISESIGDIHLQLPVIVMDGAALYDFKDRRYKKVCVIEPECSRRIAEFLDERQIPYFANVIIQDLLIIYYQQTDLEIYNQLIAKLRKSPYRNYVQRPLSDGESVVYFMLLNKTDVIESIYKEMQGSDFPANMKILKYPSKDYPGYSYIKIYDQNATRDNMLEQLIKEVNCDRVITIGTIPGRTDYVVEPGDSNRVVKLIKSIYEPFWWKKDSQTLI